MKKITLTLLVILFSVSSFGQFESRYDFGNAPPILQECDKFGKPNTFKFAPPAGYSFKISNSYNADTVIGTCLLFGKIEGDFLKLDNAKAVSNYQMYNCESVNDSIIKAKNLKEPHSGDSLRRLKENSKINDTIPLDEVEEYRLYFLIKVSDLAKYSTPFYQTWKKNKSFVVGVQAKLLKIRLKEFDFAKDVSLSSTFGLRYRTNSKKDNFLNFVANVGVSLNDLDAEVAPKLAVGASAKDIGAFSFGLGVIREYGKIQVSFMIGKDYLSKSNQNKYDWKYNGKTWISFGVGVGIFTGDDGKKQSTAEKQ